MALCINLLDLFSARGAHISRLCVQSSSEGRALSAEVVPCSNAKRLQVQLKQTHATHENHMIEQDTAKGTHMISQAEHRPS